MLNTFSFKLNYSKTRVANGSVRSYDDIKI